MKESKTSDSRSLLLRRAFEERILILDGATGTALQSAGLTAADFGGAELEGCNEVLCRTRPDLVDQVHESYLRAGADIVETNSFGATPLVLAEYGLEDEAFELNRLAAMIARAACQRYSSAERMRFVCGSMGPTTRAISVTGGVSFGELVEHFQVQAAGLIAGGADYLLLETCQDLLNTKAGLLGIDLASRESGVEIPVAVSVTVESNGTMLGGADIEAVTVALDHADLLYLGLNCATGPDQMREDLRSLSALARTRVACVPNAGMPDEEGCYLLDPTSFAKTLGDFIDQGWVNLVGGCCGTTAAHIDALARVAAGGRLREIRGHNRALVSGLQMVELSEENRPLLIGERANVLGSRKFKRLIAGGDLEAAAEIGRAQVLKGAQILDVCLQDPEIDEKGRMAAFLGKLNRRIRVPVMIDSTDPEVMETGLRNLQGKSILNSTNLEDGPERFGRVVELARRYGAAIVVGLIDEKGMATTVERKLEVARRSYGILVGDYGMRPEDIWWDTLVFPCGTGDEQYLGMTNATLEAIGILKAQFPGTRSILGVSNISFGLPSAGREVLNAVFLYRATKSGLDAAIVNTQRLARYAEIPEEERRVAEALLSLRPGDRKAGEEAVAAFVEIFRDRNTAPEPEQEWSRVDLGERLSRAVVEGSSTRLEEDLDKALGDSRWPTAMEIINGPLMQGMAEVGRLFNDNQLIVAEVLQSAEVMKRAVSFLEPHLEAGEASARGRVLLATVKGDVHDIGKNLVSIVLSNNGFEVIDLGIRVPAEQIVQAAREHRPDVIGLSGLLVKSAHQMILTAEDLSAAGIRTPLLAGGAALTRRFTHERIAAAYEGLCTYGRDAMHALELVDRLISEEKRPELEAEISLACRQGEMAEARSEPVEKKADLPGSRATIRRDFRAPTPPDFLRHVVEIDVDELWPLINPQMLYGKHLGLRGSFRALEERGDPRLAKLRDVVDEIRESLRSEGMSVRAVWKFFPARAEGDDLCLFDRETGELAARWRMPRQSRGRGLCLSDFLLDEDAVALFVTTAGVGIREKVEQLKEDGQYLKSHALASLVVETAEASAEWLHREIRARWGFADEPGTGPKEILSGRYRGKRFSFGYSACPDLSGQIQLFKLLEPEEIGVELTEGYMMDPEASVSALVFHHPDARYFSAD